MAFTIVTQGTFVQPTPAIGMSIPLPSGADYFVTTNITQMPLTPGTAVVIRGEWYGGGLTAVNDGIRWKKSSSSSAINIDTFQTSTASNGFTYVTAPPAPGPVVVGTTITQASSAVASATNTFVEGQTVVISNSVGMEQISGMTFTASSVTGSQFTLLGLDSSGFAAAATAFNVRTVAQYDAVQPQFYYVTKVTQATQAVVTVSQVHNYVVGMKVEFQIPGSFGMVQLNNFYQPQSKPPVIVAVTAYTFTINVNTTGYTAFAFPASSATPTVPLFATVAPAGASTQFNPITGVQTGYNFQYQAFRNGYFIPYMYVPSGAQSPGGAAGDTIAWQAYKMETGTINSPNPS